MKENQGIVLSILAVVLLFLTSLSANHSSAFGAQENKVGNKLHLYSGKQLSKFLDRIGFPNYPVKAVWDISRNSDGTALRFFDWSDNRVLIVNCGGRIDEIDLPGVTSWTRKPLWFDRYHRVYAFLENGQVKKTFNNGEVTIDEPGGEYYLTHATSERKTETAIHSIFRPGVVLAEENIIGKEIFLSRGKVLLFGNTYATRAVQEEIHVFERNEDKLVKVEHHIVTRPVKSSSPFNVEDVSPWSDEVLFCDVYDFPGRSKWFLYSMETRKLKELGKKPFSGGRGLFLQCDLIK